MGKKLFISILYHIGYVNTIRRQYRVRIVITGGREKYIRNRISTAHGKESEEQQSGGQKTGSEKELLPTSTSWSKKRKWAEAGGQSWTEGRWKGWSLASIEEMQLRHTRANSSYLSAFFRELQADLDFSEHQFLHHFLKWQLDKGHLENVFQGAI